MPIINDCEIWYAKVDPEHPNDKFNVERPTWECQIRTSSKEKKKEWEALNLPVKAIVPDEGEPYFRVNLRKRSIKEDGEPASPVNVVNGALEPIDGNTIGNGSVGNIRIFQYEYPSKTGGKGVASVLMGIQITKHILFKQKPRSEPFNISETQVIDPDAADVEDAAF